MRRATSPGSLWHAVAATAGLSHRALWGAKASVDLATLSARSGLGDGREALSGRSILLATIDQLTAALALIELDGVAQRIVLCPPDLPPEHLDFVMAVAEVDAIVTDQEVPAARAARVGCVVACHSETRPVAVAAGDGLPTEWVLLTSGTTGLPKLVAHNFATLTAPIQRTGALAQPAVWSTFYDIRRYGGLQILLRALVGGGSMVLSSASEPVGEFLSRAARHGITHISGTPSHWRRALMSPAAREIDPRYVRLSGEIADQGILDRLAAFYPRAGVAHAFASTEAGVAFEVGDGRTGFPAQLIGQPGAVVEMKVVEGSLRIRSPRTALRYLGRESARLAAPDGYVDTGDMIERRGERCFFVGRKDGIINVGGQKVHPEEVEAVINAHPSVDMALVKARHSPITGAVVVADVVLKHGLGPDADGAGGETVKRDIAAYCRRALPAQKVPAVIRLVPSLGVTGAGKLARR
jgi:acyl-CoA synthetase (AMP-forming)/AMP-acid ligase II